MFADEGVVGEVGVGAGDAVDFGGLTRGEAFPGIEAGDAGEQSLAAEHFVDARDAPGESVGGVEDRGVGIGQLLIRYGRSFQMEALYAVVLTIVILAVVGTTLVGYLEKRLTRWQKA